MALRRVLFVCVGNACRSQMAEGFARAYGKDVMTPESAGLAPAMAIPLQTRETMAEKNIDVSAHFPKAISVFPAGYFDFVVNMSGHPIPGLGHSAEWKVRDPIGGTPDQYRATRDQVEQLVMKLILDLRRADSGFKP